MTAPEAPSASCLRCAALHPLVEHPTGCPACAADGVPAPIVPPLSGDGPNRPAVTLGEGDTPLMPLPDLGRRLGVQGMWLKDERRNPTGSYKDRFFAACVSRAVSLGVPVVALASSGNAGVSAAAYAAAAGVECVVLTTQGITEAWRAGITAAGARLLVTETAADRWKALRVGAEQLGWYPMTNFVTPPVSSNTFGIEGYKRIAYEIVAALGGVAPDVVAMPVSRGDGLFGVWRGFLELHHTEVISTLPRMVAAERIGSLSQAVARRLPTPPALPPEPHVARSIGDVQGTFMGLHTIRQSAGSAVHVDDARLMKMSLELAREGYFLEVSSAAAACAVAELAGTGVIGPTDTVVIVGTGSGMADPSWVRGQVPESVTVTPTVERLRQAMTATS